MQTLTDDEMHNINRGFNVIRLIWIGLVIALVAYIVIANVIGKEGTITGDDDPDARQGD